MKADESRYDACVRRIAALCGCFRAVSAARHKTRGKNKRQRKGDLARTTESLYGPCLHNYTIKEALQNKAVLGFQIDYKDSLSEDTLLTVGEKLGVGSYEVLVAQDMEVREKSVLSAYYKNAGEDIYDTDEHRQGVVEYIVNKCAGKFRLNAPPGEAYEAILTVPSIEVAQKYYRLFKEFIAAGKVSAAIREKCVDFPKIAITYTVTENEEKSLDNQQTMKESLRDYNEMFGTNFALDTLAAYNTNLNDRLARKKGRYKQRKEQLDIVIVVDRLLTGFDAPPCAILFVDRPPMAPQNIIQAFSRTNRILNAVKNCGNIVCFRNLEEATNKCLGLFGDKDASGIVLMRPFDDYYNGYEELQKNGSERHVEGYVELVETLLDKFPLQKLTNLGSELERKEFIKLFGAVLKMQNLLTSFDEFTPEKFIITEFQMQDYLSWYRSHYDIYKQEREESAGKNESIEDEVVYELELVKQVSIGIDYILALVAQYHESNCQDATIRVKIQKALDASPDLKDKKELVERFIERQTPSGESVVDHWEEYVKQQRRADLDEIIRKENLKSEETYQFMQQSFDEEQVITTGLGITRILPPMPLFGGGGTGRAEKKKTVIARLEAFFKKYFNLIEDNSI